MIFWKKILGLRKIKEAPLDKDTNLEDLKKQVKEFCEDRDWDPFHNAKDLAIGAVTEASELLEPFRFQNTEQVESMMSQPQSRQKVSEEMADVLFFLLRLSQRYNIDLSESFQHKMISNDQRYPVSTFKGKNHKSHL